MTQESRGTDHIGLFFALAAASGLGLAVAFSRFAYEGGTTGLSVATLRACITVTLLFAWCLIARKRLALPWPMMLHAAGLGGTMVLMFWGNIAAVQYIPVGLAALLFYTYPPMVALAHALLHREWPGVAKTVGLSVAFAGLAVMLGVSLGSVDGRGVGLSLLAATATAANAVWLGHKLRGHDPLVVTLYMSAVAAVILLVVLAATGGPVWPTTGGGWFGMLATGTTQSLAVPFYFLAIARIGAMRSAMFSNIQPVVSIVAAWLLFGDLLGPAQFVGGAMVLGAIFCVQLSDARATRKESEN